MQDDRDESSQDAPVYAFRGNPGGSWNYNENTERGAVGNWGTGRHRPPFRLTRISAFRVRSEIQTGDIS
jgi:hypothetical protein